MTHDPGACRGFSLERPMHERANHPMRHGFNQMMAREGVSPKVRQIMMRHSDSRLTLETYTDTLTTDHGRAMREVGARYKSKKNNPMSKTSVDEGGDSPDDSGSSSEVSSVVAANAPTTHRTSQLAPMRGSSPLIRSLNEVHDETHSEVRESPLESSDPTRSQLIDEADRMARLARSGSPFEIIERAGRVCALAESIARKGG